MHSRTQSGIPLDWQDVPRVSDKERAEAHRQAQLARINDAIRLSGRQATPEEIAAAQAVLDADPNAPQSDMFVKRSAA